MNRLFSRIFLAMLIVTAISLVAVPLTQSFLTKRTIDELAPEFRELLEQRTRPPRPAEFFSSRPNENRLPPPRLNNRNNNRNNNQEGNGRNSNQRNQQRLQEQGQVTRPLPPAFALRLDGSNFGINPNFAVNEVDAVDLEELLSSRPLQRQLAAALQGIPVRQVENNNLTERLFSFVGSYRSSIRQGMLIGILIASLASVLLAAWLARALSKPLEAVSGAAGTIAKGDLSSRVALKRFAQQPKETQSLATSFNNMAESLESAQEERKAMIADIAHELRNPLATMQFRIDALQDGLLEPNQKEFGVLQDQVGLLSRLVDDLRTLSLADAGQLSLNKESVDLKHLLENIKMQWQESAEKQNISLSFSTELESAVANVDADRIAQVMHNLITNALKVLDIADSDTEGNINISLNIDNGQYLIKVEDDGPGIPEEKLDSLFERFVQGERRDVKGKESSGLGLTIVRTFVELHGGSVTARNSSSGAIFEVYIPKA